MTKNELNGKLYMYGILLLIDTIITYILLKIGFTELNPLGFNIYTISFKIVSYIGLGIILMLYDYLNDKTRDIYRKSLISLNIFYMTVFVWNIFQLTKYKI